MGNVSILSINEKKPSEFNEDFMKNYNEINNKLYLLEADVEYLKDLHGLNSHLPFLPESMKIKNCKKLAWNLLCYSHKSLKVSIKTRVNFLKNA